MNGQIPGTGELMQIMAMAEEFCEHYKPARFIYPPTG
jgi:hypothetical protein